MDRLRSGTGKYELIEAVASRICDSLARSSLVWRNLEADQLGAESVRAICPVTDAGNHPYGA